MYVIKQRKIKKNKSMLLNINNIPINKYNKAGFNKIVVNFKLMNEFFENNLLFLLKV